MATDPDKLVVVTTLKADHGKPFLITWDRQTGELSFPNGPENSMIIKSIRTRIDRAERCDFVELWPTASWEGKADMKNPVFIRAILESAGLHPSLQPPACMAHLKESFWGMELPPELAAIDPWTPYPPLPPGAIA